MMDSEQILEYLELCDNIENNLKKRIIYYQENPKELTSKISNNIHEKVELVIRTKQMLKEKELESGVHNLLLLKN